MKKYQIYLFVQENCPPCKRVKDHLKTLTKAEGKEIHVIPFRNAEGETDPLATQFAVTLTPSLVVTHVDETCKFTAGDEFYDQYERIVETIVGGNSIISSLDSTLDAYTYAHEPPVGATA